MPTPIFRGSVLGGKLRLDLRAQFDAYAQTLEGKRVELVLRREVQRRGSAQNRYYRGVVLPIFAEHLGCDRDDLHYELRKKFLSTSDAPLAVPRSTADLDTAEFARFVDDTRRLAAEYGCAIPDPQDAE